MIDKLTAGEKNDLLALTGGFMNCEENKAGLTQLCVIILKTAIYAFRQVVTEAPTK